MSGVDWFPPTGSTLPLAVSLYIAFCAARAHGRRQLDVGRSSMRITGPGRAGRFPFHRPGGRIGVTEERVQVKRGMDDTSISSGNLIQIARTCLGIPRIRTSQLRSVAKLA